MRFLSCAVSASILIISSTLVLAEEFKLKPGDKKTIGEDMVMCEQTPDQLMVGDKVWRYIGMIAPQYVNDACDVLGFRRPEGVLLGASRLSLRQHFYEKNQNDFITHYNSKYIPTLEGGGVNVSTGEMKDSLPREAKSVAHPMFCVKDKESE